MITGGFGLVFLVQKWWLRDANLFFKRWVAETPLFIVLEGYWTKLSTMGKFEPPPKHNLADNWKARFWYFLVFLCFCLMFFLIFPFCLFLFLFYLGWFKGQVRWPKGPPHLALNPPFFLFLCVCVFFFLFFFFFFLSLLFIEKTVVPGKKGHVCLISSVSLCFSLAFFASPFFAVSFSVSILLFSFFLPSCHYFLLSFASLCLSLSL